MIREAKQTDIPDLIPLAIEALKSDSYPELKIDQSRVFTQITACVVSRQHFCWVSEQDGEIVGGLGAIVAPQAVYEGNHAIIFGWYCRKPGDGLKLMKQFLNWVQEKKNVHSIEYSLPKKDRERISKVVKRLGFRTPVPALCMLR